jgi:hypothetical protein
MYALTQADRVVILTMLFISTRGGSASFKIMTAAGFLFSYLNDTRLLSPPLNDGAGNWARENFAPCSGDSKKIPGLFQKLIFWNSLYYIKMRC